MSAILFGQCGCCGGLVTEQQAVIAGLPFNFGWEQDEAGNIFATSYWLGRKYPPQTIYRTMTQDFIDLETNQIVNTVVLTYNIFGKRTMIGSGSWPDEVWHRTSKSRLSDPYTYSECATNAAGMLANADLINPDRVYQMETADRAFYPSGAPSALTHLTYPSEAIGYVPARCASNLFVHADEDGAVYFSNQDFPGSVGVYAVAARNGFMNTIFDGSFRLSGWVVAQKTAVRTPVAYKSRLDAFVVLANASNAERFAPVAPVDLGPGELLFDPTDVPIIGMSTWQTTAAPPLPAP